MRTASNYRLSAIFLLLILPGFLLSQKTVSKEEDQQFAFDEKGVLTLENKYGDLSVIGWEKDSVKYHLQVIATGKTRQDAEEMLDRIVAVTTFAGDYVDLKTEIRERKKSFMNKFFKDFNPFDFDKADIDIDLVVWLPSNTELNLTNKYGDIEIEDYYGRLQVDLQHGDLRLGSTVSDAEIDMKYGKLTAFALPRSEIVLKGGNLNVKEAESMRLDIAGSTVEIDRIDQLVLYSSKDEIELKYCGSLQGEVRYSDVNVVELQDRLDVHIHLGELDVESILDPAPSIKLEEYSSEIQINISGTSFEIEANLEDGVLRLPISVENLTSNVLDERKRIREIRASYGSSPAGKIVVQGKKGFVEFKKEG